MSFVSNTLTAASHERSELDTPGPLNGKRWDSLDNMESISLRRLLSFSLALLLFATELQKGVFWICHWS